MDRWIGYLGSDNFCNGADDILQILPILTNPSTYPNISYISYISLTSKFPDEVNTRICKNNMQNNKNMQKNYYYRQNMLKIAWYAYVYVK